MSLKKVFLLSAIILAASGISDGVKAAPSTKSRFAIGGQNLLAPVRFDQSSATSASLNTGSSIAVRYGLNDSLKLDGLLNFGLAGVNNDIVIGLGAQAEFTLKKDVKDVNPYFGVGLMFNGLGQTSSLITLLPSFGVEYFITEHLTIDGAVGLPISLQTVKDAPMKFGGISTQVSPTLGFHFYL